MNIFEYRLLDGPADAHYTNSAFTLCAALDMISPARVRAPPSRYGMMRHANNWPSYNAPANVYYKCMCESLSYIIDFSPLNKLSVCRGTSIRNLI